ncbi:MAG: mycothiol conjugate amidase Mca [Acidimicrobiia bacterium]|nr:mycothiol conjugate amidase Mca [Acidimicrobiia bacterium]
MTVHAHPDDEASKGPATVTKAAASGAATVLVCCTGGEQGDILNPALDNPEVRDRLPEVRMEELQASVDVIGYETLELLGYRDSGMPDTPANEDPRCFARAGADEAVGRLVALIRRHRPHVIITYGDDQRGYPHPDHLRVHDISVVAFDAAGDPDAFAGAGEPWQPLKLYYSVWSKARMLAMHAKFEELGLESPFSQEWLDRPSQDERITTRIDITDFADVRPKALLAHRTQIDPDSPFWFGIPLEEQRRVHPFDEYVLARSLVDTDQPEDDVFAGLHAAARSA